jgi:putative tryptophan/tyrosine transport system substrate-binding protein
MQRREFIAGLASAAAWLSMARAQQPNHVARIGVLMVPRLDDRTLANFRQGLIALGHVEGRTFILDVRSAEGRPDRLPVLAVELVERKVDVILSFSAVASLAASQATATIPIVQANGGDPVRSSRIAGSLAQPGGNLTGLTNQSEDLSGKLLQLLLLIIPATTPIGVLLVPGAPVTEPELRLIKEAARLLGVTIHEGAVPDAATLDDAFAILARENVGRLVVFSGALFSGQRRRRIVDLAAQAKLPTIYPYRSYVDDGGLISYGVNANDAFGQAARFVDRILKGARPSDLPIEQPTKFEMVINLKTAKALGLTVPETLLATADTSGLPTKAWTGLGRPATAPFRPHPQVV